MNWKSEVAVLWLPVAGKPYPQDFANRAEPGANDFYYLAPDAFDAIRRRRSDEYDREPWAYVLAENHILSPAEIDELMDEFEPEYAAQTPFDMEKSQ